MGNANLTLSSTTWCIWDFLGLWSDCSVTQESPSVREGGKRPELHTKFEVWVNHGFMQWLKYLSGFSSMAVPFQTYSSGSAIQHQADVQSVVALRSPSSMVIMIRQSPSFCVGG